MSLQAQLLEACSTGDLERVQALHQQLKTEPASSSSEPIPLQELLKVATAKDHARIAEYCLQQGAVIDSAVSSAALHKGATPELWAVLLRANWNDVQRNRAVLDSLLVLSPGRGERMISFLLDQGASVRARGVLAAAARSRAPDAVGIIALLLERGAGATSDARTPTTDLLRNSGALQMAAYDGLLEMVRFLLDAGADVNEIPADDPGDPREQSNGSALHLAVAAGRPDMVELLLQRGADPALKDQGGLDALELARQRRVPNKQAVISLLERAAERVD